MPEPRPDPMTELVRILREQLDHKDERITALEKLLEEANHRIDEQQRLMVRLLERSFDRSWSQSDVAARERAAQPPLLGSANPEEVSDHPREAAGERSPVAAHDDAARPEAAAESSSVPAIPVDVASEQAVEVWVSAEVEASATAESERGDAVATMAPTPRRDFAVLPDLGPQIEVIATAVAAASARKAVYEEAAIPAAVAAPESERHVLSVRSHGYASTQDEFEITLRLDRQKLHKGHKALERAKRGLLPWRRNRQA
jgi:hypothetical protein